MMHFLRLWQLLCISLLAKDEDRVPYIKRCSLIRPELEPFNLYIECGNCGWESVACTGAVELRGEVTRHDREKGLNNCKIRLVQILRHRLQRTDPSNWLADLQSGELTVDVTRKIDRWHNKDTDVDISLWELE